ncbi:hypothetical protein GCM10010172_67890 [Paractinoplanes ferrugineus]|uniref:Uncharacterized protein n=1 Tax=Paractinoplanes ferrugineus TaxID=113564 RepID=A0A919JB05_9ACTN|nr:hypothetical protein Afe05nite_83970 [Actinoplanes ferrugineus]
MPSLALAVRPVFPPAAGDARIHPAVPGADLTPPMAAFVDPGGRTTGIATPRPARVQHRAAHAATGIEIEIGGPW